VRTAAPVVHQILLHHSMWPFKPDDDSVLTLEGFAIAVALLTGEDQFYICFEERLGPHGVFERPRNWKDRSRLLFQSLCSINNWTEGLAQNCRADGDDEDLVAVLHESMPQRQHQNRERFLPVAASLPSSHSQKLAGSVQVQSVQANTDQLRRPSAKVQENLHSVAKAITSSLLTHNTSISWRQFQMLADISTVSYPSTQLQATKLTLLTSHFYLLA
jgi:hypothetical protein